MSHGNTAVGRGTTLEIEDFLDRQGRIVIPPDVTLVSFLEANCAALCGQLAYRYLDYSREQDGVAVELTWDRLGVRMHAVAGRLRQVCHPGDRVAILAPQGVDYVIGVFAAICAGTIAVPLFAPELPGHAERLAAVIGDARPSVVLTTSDAAPRVRESLNSLPREQRPRIIALEAIPDSVGRHFIPVDAQPDDIAYLQYTSGSTRTPAGVEITHRAVCVNVLQMITAVGLDRDIASVSWLPLFHDMGLLMTMFPALCGGFLTLMSPTAFVRRPRRWINELAAHARDRRTFAAAPNFAFELAAKRGVPEDPTTVDLSNVAGLINVAEVVNIATIERFNEAFAPCGLPATAVKPSYGMAEATLFVSTIDPGAAASAVHLDRVALGAGLAARISPHDPRAVPSVSCGRVSRSQWAVIVDSPSGSELPDGHVGEIWLHGQNVAKAYWGRAEESKAAFGNLLAARTESHSRAAGTSADAPWFRTGDVGVYLDDELYATGRTKDLIIIDGRNHYPHDIEATTAAASEAIRTDFVAAFSVPDPAVGERLVIIAERSSHTGRFDASNVIDTVRAAVSRRHGLAVADVQMVTAGTIARTTSGKLSRQACRADYLAGKWATE